MDGQKVFEYLSKLTEAQRKAIIVDNFWYPTVIDEVLDDYETPFTEKEEKILRALPDHEKMGIIEKAHDAAIGSEGRSMNDECEIKGRIIGEMGKWLETHKTEHYHVTIRFAMFATVDADAIDARMATKMAYQMVKDGKVTVEDLKEYDTMWPYCQVTSVYNFDKDVMELEENESDPNRRPKDKDAFNYATKEA